MMPGNFSSCSSMAAINASLFWWKSGRHWPLGFKSTKYSVLKKPAVSVPSSGRPVWLTTCVTSGKEAITRRALLVKSMLAVGLRWGAMFHAPRWNLVEMGQKLRSDGPPKPGKRNSEQNAQVPSVMLRCRMAERTEAR